LGEIQFVNARDLDHHFACEPEEVITIMIYPRMERLWDRQGGIQFVVVGCCLEDARKTKEVYTGAD